MCGFQGTQKPYTISGDNGERDPPVPIPNTEVKPFSADGTWLETIWESRTLPDSTKRKPQTMSGAFSLCIPSGPSSRSFSSQRPTLYLVRFPHVRRQWRIQHGAMPGRVGGKARKKLCVSVTSISPVVFNECATLYLVRIFSAAHCAGFRQKNFPSPRLRITSKHMSK